MKKRSPELEQLDLYTQIKVIKCIDILIYKIIGVGLPINCIAKLANALCSNLYQNLVELHLSKNKLGEQGIQLLSSALKSSSCIGLEVLDVSENRISISGTNVLSSAFLTGACLHLKSLNLNDNQIVGKGITYLMEVFKKGACPNLEILKIGCIFTLFLYLFYIVNRFGNTGLLQLIQTLKKGGLPHLKELDLAFNRIGDSSLREFSKECIKSAPHLKSLVFDGNIITHTGIEYLASGMSKGALKELDKLSLKWNETSNMAMEKLSQSIRIQKILTTLTYIDLERIYIYILYFFSFLLFFFLSFNLYLLFLFLIFHLIYMYYFNRL